jgi:hypothetical protein
LEVGSSGGGGLESSLLELELLLLESSLPGSLGGGCVGNGCWVAASGGVVDDLVAGFGESGGVADLLGSPGNGNCSAADFGAGVGGVQGLVAWPGVWFGLWLGFWFELWLGAGHGAAGGFCAGGVCAREVAVRRKATCSARVIG